MPEIAIIGGGITGLAAAFTLKQHGVDVCLFEEKTQTGGMIQTRRENGFLVESGPHALMEKGPAISRLIHDLNLTDRRIYPDSAARRRYIVRNRKLIPLPGSPIDILRSRLFSTRGKCRAALEPLVPRRTSGDEETLADFIDRRLGSEIVDYAVNPFVGGIFAGDPALLSVQHAFPFLSQMEQEHGSLFRAAMHKRKQVSGRKQPRFFSFDEGLGVLTTALTDALGDDVLLNSRIESLSRNSTWKLHWQTGGERFKQSFDAVLVATPAYRISDFAKEVENASCLRPLDGLPYAPISLLTLGFSRKDVGHPLDGFGALAPARENLPFLGINFSSSTFPNRAPENFVSLAVYVGGTRQPELAEDVSTDSQLARVLPALKQVLSINGDPVFVSHQQISNAIPQYNIGHGQYLNLLANIERKNRGLFFAGNYRCGISIGECIQSGVTSAERILIEKEAR